MALDRSARCMECGNSALLAADPTSIVDLVEALPSTWSVGESDGIIWAVCSDSCRKRLTPEKVRQYRDERVARFRGERR